MTTFSPGSSPPPLPVGTQNYVVPSFSQCRSHPAIIPRPNGGLEINIDLVPHSPNTIMICTGADWEIDSMVLNNVLYDHSYTVHHIMVTITFQDSRNETIRQKHDQSLLIQAVALGIGNFPFLRTLDIRLALPTEQFSQQKNVAYFWQIKFWTWHLWQKVGDEEGYKHIGVESHLTRDLVKYGRHLRAAGMM